MDPSIMKLLEEDEDESMHCGADVEAFQAALNRDIGVDTSASVVSDPVLTHEPNQTSSIPYSNRHIIKQEENANSPGQQPQQEEQNSLGMDMKRHGSVVENQQLQNDVKQEPSQLPLHLKQSQDNVRQGEAEKIPPQNQTTGVKISERQPLEQPGNLKTQAKQIPIMLLLPKLMPHLDKDRGLQLQTLISKLRKNEISRELFAKHIKNIVGDQLLRLALSQFQSQPGFNQSQLQSQAFDHEQNLRMPTSASASSTVKVQAGSSYQSVESNAQKPREAERQLDSQGAHVSQMPSSGSGLANQDREQSSMLGENKQHQHLNIPQSSFPMYGSRSGTLHPYSGTNLNSSGSSTKLQPRDLQTMQMSHQVNGVSQIRGSSQSNLMGVPKFDRQSTITDPRSVQRAPFSSSCAKQDTVEHSSEHLQKSQSTSQALSAAPVKQGNAVPANLKDESLDKQSSKVGFPSHMSGLHLNSITPSIPIQLDPDVQVSSRISSVAPTGANARTPPKKPLVGQKKPFEALGSSPPASSKKQKVSDQSIDQLNDVTAVSGVDLREEEEQLFSWSKEESRASEASRKVVREEEEKLILQKIPLQKKLAEIMVKCGLKNINNDVERCLSLCVEERLRGLITNLIRLSKQRVDAEKLRHRTVVTSDVRQQLVAMNKKAKEEWEKKQAEAEKLGRVNEPEGENGMDGDKEKDENRLKSLKINKEVDDKRRTTAANVAARAAVGGDDMLSKWQLMAEQARQKREVPSGSQSGKSGKNMKDSQAAAKTASRDVRKFGRKQVIAPQIRVARSISVKDVIAALEREPQMSKSIFVYRLHERICSNASAE